MKTLTKSLTRSWFPPRPSNANKGRFGRLYLIAGSKGMTGAAVLSAMGAMRSGAGLVKVATPQSQQALVARRAPLEVTTQGLKASADGTLALGAWPQIKTSLKTFRPTLLAVGPGLGQSRALQSLIKKLIYQTTLPLVLDADGLNALSRLGLKKRKAPWIITPHPGEMARLTKKSIKHVQENRKAVAIDVARKLGCVCVLKGKGTVITDGRLTYKNSTGNTGLAKGGTGDVLTGIIAGLWGQYKDQSLKSGLKAAALGVYLHGKSADLGAKKKGERSLLASDLLDYLPTKA